MIYRESLWTIEGENKMVPKVGCVELINNKEIFKPRRKSDVFSYNHAHKDQELYNVICNKSY